MFKKSTTIPVINLHGCIGNGNDNISMKNMGSEIEKAFSIKNSPVVVLSINSPGGSPTQSALVGKRIEQLSKENNKKVIAFCEDVAASGGYWLALSAKEIYAMPTSIIGSIGVISASFGFEKFIEKHSIDRRVFTSGSSKSKLDPFLELKQEDKDKISSLQNTIHEEFINHVKNRRNLKQQNDVDLFNGDFWCGNEAKQYGLIDDINDMHTVLKEKYGNVKIKRFSQKRSFLEKLKNGNAVLDSNEFIESFFSKIKTELEYSKFIS